MVPRARRARALIGRTVLALAATLAATLVASPAAAASSPAALRACAEARPLTVREQDRLLQFAALVRAELDAAAPAVAIVARSGLDLRRFGLRYSHAGVALRASEHGRWAVRQLYYACDERRPRLYDEGLAGFFRGTDDPALGYARLLLLPAEAAAALERAALDRDLALALLGTSYSANAHAFALRHQNCNQWLLELLAVAGGAAVPDGTAPAAGALRPRAQAWLREQGYEPQPVEVGSHALMFAAAFVPWLRLDDHPEEDRFALRLRVTTPETIEAFVRRRWPGVRAIELCHDERRAVVRHDGAALPDGCRAAPGDRVVALD